MKLKNISNPFKKKYNYLCKNWKVFQIYDNTIIKVGNLIISKKWMGLRLSLVYKSTNLDDDRFDYKGKINVINTKIANSQTREYRVFHCQAKGHCEHNNKKYKGIMYFVLDVYKPKNIKEINNIVGIATSTYRKYINEKTYPMLYSSNIILSDGDLKDKETILSKIKENNYYIENCNELFTNDNVFD